MQFRHCLAIFAMLAVLGDLSDPMVPTLRGVSGYVLTVYAYQGTKGHFLQFVALPRARRNPCQRRDGLFPPVMAYMSELAGAQPASAGFHLGRLKNGLFLIL